MSASRLTTGTYELWLGVVAALENEGYPFDPATTSANRYLATALRGIAGGTTTELNTGFADLLAALVVVLGGSGNVRDHDEQELMARLIDAAGGGGGAPSGPLLLIGGGPLNLIAGGDLLLTGA